jgi:hypothetical protein
VAILISLALTATSQGCASRQQVQAKHEAGDQAVLRKYMDDFKPGVTRKEVEDYLQAKGVHFSRYGDMKLYRPLVSGAKAVTPNLAAWSDMIRIRNEHVAWLCGDGVVFIAIQFEASEDPHSTVAQGSDRLTEVGLYYLPPDCPAS